MTRTLGNRLWWIALTAVPAGCATMPDAGTLDGRGTAVITQTSDAIELDGRLDEPAWSTARVYHLGLSREAVADGRSLAEPGCVRLMHDDEWLYVGISFRDSDVIAEGDRDQLHHYKLGDVAELFIKPVGRSWYWELYATPAGLKSAFFIPGRGRLPLPSNFEYASKFRVAAVVSGSLNHWQDRDDGWAAEMAMPLSELAVDGDPVSPEELSVLVARYNYSRYLPGAELSTWPVLDRVDFHRYEKYAVLKSVGVGND